jgi:hypothetical protein
MAINIAFVPVYIQLLIAFGPGILIIGKDAVRFGLRK